MQVVNVSGTANTKFFVLFLCFACFVCFLVGWVGLVGVFCFCFFIIRLTILFHAVSFASDQCIMNLATS